MVTVALTAGVIVLGTALGITLNSLRHRSNELAGYKQVNQDLKGKLEAEQASHNQTVSELTYYKTIQSQSHYRVGNSMLPLGQLPAPNQLN